MLKVALTGGIATGKSYVVQECLKRGVPCLDADELSHGVMTAGTEATAAIAERFGPEVLDASGAVNRQVLGAKVFADAGARRDLEAIVHPAVYRALAVGLRAFERMGGSAMAIADIPLLYETGHAEDFDRVIATTCEPEIQRARLAARGLTALQIEQRLSAQIPAAEKAARADYAIDTSDSFESTNEQIDRLLAILLKSAS
jgi:dephospho-CoA kinase